MEQRFASVGEKLKYADQQLLANVKPEVVAEECGYKNKASLMVSVSQYRNSKRKGIDATEPDKLPDFVQEVIHSNRIIPAENAAKSLEKKLIEKIAQEVVNPDGAAEASSHLGYEAQPIHGPHGPLVSIPTQSATAERIGPCGISGISTPTGKWIFVPDDLRITEMQGLYADYRTDDGEICAYNQVDHFTRASAAGFANELSTVASIMLPEVPDA